jgi:hypothetical protein
MDILDLVDDLIIQHYKNDDYYAKMTLDGIIYSLNNKKIKSLRSKKKMDEYLHLKVIVDEIYKKRDLAFANRRR